MPRPRINIEPRMIFNHLTVDSKATPSNAGHPRWVCLCVCGKKSIVRQSHLISGSAKSCGCMTMRNVKHGGYNTPEYHSWKAMKARCLSVTNRQYPLYGGRGITVCDRWLDFAKFREDMGDRPQGTTLDRKNNAKGYSPDNCRWATPSVQMNNRGESNTRITFDGRTMTVKEWCGLLGVPYERVIARLSYGWSFVEAVTLSFYARATR